MKIICPKCRKQVPAEQINVATDLAFCPDCSEGFKVSESIDQDEVKPEQVFNPPKGAWFKEEVDRIVVGATIRHRIIAIFLVSFTCIWSGGSITGIYITQIVKGDFDLSQSLFGIPFLLASIVLIPVTLMSVFGKVEVSIGNISSVFVGLGKIGWRRQFDWLNIKSIRKIISHNSESNTLSYSILLGGEQSLHFWTGLNETRCNYILNVLKYLKSQQR